MAEIIYGWNNEPLGVRTGKGENPMLAKGYGPAGKHCGDCKHLKRELYKSKTYLKCELYGHTRGSGSDFRAKWPACRKFEAK